MGEGVRNIPENTMGEPSTFPITRCNWVRSAVPAGGLEIALDSRIGLPTEINAKTGWRRRFDLSTGLISGQGVIGWDPSCYWNRGIVLSGAYRRVIRFYPQRPNREISVILDVGTRQ